MASLVDLRSRSEGLFRQLLLDQTRAVPKPRRRPAAAAPPPVPTFSWFTPEDAVGAATLSFRLAAFAASRARVNDGLERALNHIEQERAHAAPELLRQGFALFVTHNRDGRRLSKPRTVAAAPALFRPPVRGGPPLAVSIGGKSPGLDYWREDALANEHHAHWHEVYPFTGIPPKDFVAWRAATPQADIVAILELVLPGRDWLAFVSSATDRALAEEFARVLRDQDVFRLPRRLYRRLFTVNDRQGEIFFYMHEQMLARYDAELLSNDLDRVEPFAPNLWTRPIPEGHDPIGLPRFSRRDVDRALTTDNVDVLRARDREIQVALDTKVLRGPNDTTVAIDRTNFGEAVEGTIPQLRELDPRSYFGLHNVGHSFIAKLSTPPLEGVMTATLSAIRDQIFWRWHKYIDDLNAAWQNTQEPYDFSDGPEVLVRNGLTAAATTAWKSPDIILCFGVDLPDNVDAAALGQQLFGGDNWDKDFGASEGSADGTTVRTRDELTTTMKSVPFGGRNIEFLSHEPFSYFLRIENPSAQARDVTVRMFLAPATHAADRRAWIEMDKFLVTIPGATKLVVHRPDTASSVVKRPIDVNPSRVLGDGGSPNEDSYCDCGWPYTLLLPRGTPAGSDYRLMVICTDAGIDRVPAQGTCGSMSYCGAVGRYPDTRDMGYPFARPFGGSARTAIRDVIVNLPSAAARTVRIRHTG